MTDAETSAPVFTHHDLGTSDATWFADPLWDSVPTVTPDDLLQGSACRVVVVSAHPDDETLGAGGIIAALASQGVQIILMLATAGEGSHPDSSVWRPSALAEQRLTEWHDAAHELAPLARKVFLELPDGRVAEHEDELSAALRPLLGPDTLVLAPYREDGHPDHEAAGRAARRTAEETGALCLEYPVWWWHWNHPTTAHDHLLEHALVVEPGAEAIHAKHRAMDRYPSQVQGLGPGEPHQPVVTHSVWQRGRRTIDVLFHDNTFPARTTNTVARGETFEAMYDAGDDPWGWEDSWYEQRRRAMICAQLGRARYRRVLELGCGTGLLTRDLAARADAVEALDISHRALDVARRRGVDGVRWHHAELPDQLPQGPFDLVVVSEVAYFLRPVELMSLLRQLHPRMTDDAELLLADWAHPTTGIPLDGPLVHEMLEQLLALERTASYRDRDVWIDSWSTDPSPAAKEGLA